MAFHWVTIKNLVTVVGVLSIKWEIAVLTPYLSVNSFHKKASLSENAFGFL